MASAFSCHLLQDLTSRWVACLNNTLLANWKYFAMMTLEDWSYVHDNDLHWWHMLWPAPLRSVVTSPVQGVQKTLLKEICDFLTLQMLPMTLALIEPNYFHFLTHWSENDHFTRKIRFLNNKRKFPIEKRDFWQIGQRDGNIFLDQRQS